MLVFAGSLGLLCSQGSGDELGSQWVQHVGLLQLESLQLGLDLLKCDSVQTAVIMTDGDERFPELSVQGQRDVYSEHYDPQSQLCLLYTELYIGGEKNNNNNKKTRIHAAREIC